MTTQEPKVSILLPYYNDLKHIEESIASVYNQTYQNWELIVVNDVSPDQQAVELITTLSEKYGFTLIHHKKNMGASKAFQTAFEHSTGDYISLIAHDDRYTPEKIEYSIKQIQNRGLDAVYCNGVQLRENGKTNPFPVDEVLQEQKKGQDHVAALINRRDTVGCLLTQGAVYKRRILEELSWVKDLFLLDDWPFTILVWRNYKTYFDPHPVYEYRFHEDNIHKNFWKWFPARIQVVSELVETEKKLDVLSFLISNIGEFSRQNHRNEDAFRLLTAGLFLADSEENINYALEQISKTKIPRSSIKSMRKRSRELLFRTRPGYRIYRKIMRSIIKRISNSDKRATLIKRLKI